MHIQKLGLVKECGLNCTPTSWNSDRWYITMWPYLEIGHLRGNQVKMRSLQWTLTQYDSCFYKKGEHWTQRLTHIPTDCQVKSYFAISLSTTRKAVREAWNTSSPSTFRGSRAQPCWHIDDRLQVANSCFFEGSMEVSVSIIFHHWLGCWFRPGYLAPHLHHLVAEVSLPFQMDLLDRLYSHARPSLFLMCVTSGTWETRNFHLVSEGLLESRYSILVPQAASANCFSIGCF